MQNNWKHAVNTTYNTRDEFNKTMKKEKSLNNQVSTSISRELINDFKYILTIQIIIKVFKTKCHHNWLRQPFQNAATKSQYLIFSLYYFISKHITKNIAALNFTIDDPTVKKNKMKT